MPHPDRPSITEIAAAVGVSAMAVSYALRGSPQVSAATREKILRQAQKMGYRRDPLLVHLMQHVRTRRIRRTQANLGLLAVNRDSYSARIVAGVETRAAELGYAIDRVDLAPFRGRPARLTQMLEARGITGLILPPRARSESLAQLLEWSRFATIATSYSILEPRFHRVVPHQFHNAMLILRCLRERGYRRATFVINGDMERRTNHAYRAALAASSEAQGSWIEPFVTSGPADGFGAWFDRHEPDALIPSGIARPLEWLRTRLGAAKLRRVGVAVMDHGHDDYSGLAGIDQQPSLIGAVAVDMLVAQLHRQEKGIPRHPIVSMIEGEWAADQSIREPVATATAVELRTPGVNGLRR